MTVRFLNAMQAEGFEVSEVIADGGFHRFRVEGDRAGQKSGWYCLHGDWGSYGDWRAGFKRTWRANADIDVAAAVRHRTERQFEAHAEAREKAEAIWRESASVIAHSYLTAKCVRAHGIRVYRGSLVVPARIDGELSTLQFIRPDGQKRFLRGGRKRGAYHVIGTLESALFIAEGYATAASIFEATGVPTVVAFDAGNLLPVGRAIRESYPDAQIIFAADNDKTVGNPGVTKATSAAKDIGASYVYPSEFGDFNDLLIRAGVEVVGRELIGARYERLHGN